MASVERKKGQNQTDTLLPKKLTLPDGPTREQILLFLGMIVLEWNNLTPKQRQLALNLLSKETRHLEK